MKHTLNLPAAKTFFFLVFFFVGSNGQLFNTREVERIEEINGDRGGGGVNCSLLRLGGHCYWRHRSGWVTAIPHPLVFLKIKEESEWHKCVLYNIKIPREIVIKLKIH